MLDQATSDFRNSETISMKTKTPLFMNLRLPNKFLFYQLILTGATLATASAGTIYPVNNGFEQPDLGSGGLAYQYFPSSPGWTFFAANGNGIAANGSDFNLKGATNGNKDNGATSTVGQAAFLQGGDGTLAGGNFSQTLALPAEDWVLRFSLEGRANNDGANGVNVFLDGVQVGNTLFPANLGTFNDASVKLGNLTAGSHTIAFAGTVSEGDHTTFVDNVRLKTASVPDSGATLLLMLASVAASFGFNLLLRKRPEA